MSTEMKRLYRSQKDRMFGGVCAGLGEFLNIDPTVIRLLFVLATVFGGAGIVIYLAMLLVVPEAPLPEGAAPAEVVDEPAEAEE